MIKEILDKGYCKIDYQIDIPIKEFDNVEWNNFHDNYWKMEMYDWTPFLEMKAEKWCSEMYNLNMDILDDPLYENTKNFKASILKYNKGYIREHTDRGTLSFLYNIYPGMYLKINEQWEELDYGLFIWLGDMGAKQFNKPAMEHKVKCENIRWSLNYFSAPTDIDYPWTVPENNE